jgi:hypothetical protein
VGAARLAVAALIAAGLAVAGCGSPAPTGPAAPSPRASLSPAGSAPVPGDAPVPIEAVESGFTAFSTDGADLASYGIVLHNPNVAWAAFRMEIRVDFFDAADAFIAGEEVFVQLLPGQTSAIAGEAHGAGTATRMEIGIPDDPTAFAPAEPSSETFGLAEVATTARDGLVVTTGRLTSGFGTTERLVQVAAVHRDAGGTILGGATGGIESIEPGATIPFEVIDGAPHAAIAATDVYWQLSGIGR